MNTKRRGLGRGLDALLGGSGVSGGGDADLAEVDADAGDRLLSLPVDVMRRGRYQPRSDMRPETLTELADSIRSQGVVQPIVVRSVGEGGEYEIIAGERRWRAAQMAGLHEVPVVVKNVTDRAAVAMALIENIQRENLNPLEEANALRRLIKEFDLTHQAAAEAVGRSRVAVSNLLRLFELNDDVKEKIERRELEMGHARALLGLRDGQQSEAAGQVVARGLSVRETEQLVRRMQKGPSKPKSPPAEDPDVRRLQGELSERLGARVRLMHSSGGKGKLVIHYNDLDELEGILDHIK